MYKKLTEEQVKKLFAYCLKYEIYEYDLQIEIIDHLASSIEDQWQKDPELSFGWALKNTLEKFGKNGLQKLERKLKKQLRRNFNLILWRYFLEYFRLPKILITAALFTVLFAVLRIAQNNYQVLLFITVPLSLFAFYYGYFYFPRKVDIKTANDKTFVLLDYLKNINTKVGVFIQSPFFALMFSSGNRLRYSNAIWEEIVISAVIALFLVFSYGHFFFLPNKIRAYFFKNYAEHAQ